MNIRERDLRADPSPRDARACARLGLDALRRYFKAYTGEPGRGADFDAAEHYLGAALSGLAPDDPLRFDVSFALGGLRIADHETRCASPCPAPRELRPIAALLAVAGDRQRAPADHLYGYAITVDKLYDHTREPADIELAMVWLRRAAEHRKVSQADRRRALISLAVQHANRGDVLREARGRSGPGSESWPAYSAAIEQFEAVLAGLAGRGKRKDTTRDTDRLDALLGLVETYFQRGGERPSDEDLEIMVGLGRQLSAAMTPGYPRRSFALGRYGVLLLQRITRRTGDPWDSALNTVFAQLRPTAIAEALSTVPGTGADLDSAIDALTHAAGLEDHASRLQPLFAAGLCMGRALRYVVRSADEDLREVGRLCRIVMGHPGVDPSYRRQCGEWLTLVLTQRLQASGTGLEIVRTGPTTLSPSADADLDTLIGLLGRFVAADGPELAPALSAAFASLVTSRAGGELTDAELAASYSRQREAAASVADLPAAHAMQLYLSAATGAEWVRRGTGPAGLAAQVAGAFQQAIRGLGPAHPMARYIASLAAAFSEESRTRPERAPVSPPETATYHVQADPEAFDPRAVALLGASSDGRLAVPTGRVVEVVEPLLSPPPREAVRHAAVRSVLALALHARWLRERAGADLTAAISQVRQAISLPPDRHPLRHRLAELLAGMLLDRCQVNGDHADADAALAALEELLDQVAEEQQPRDLNELLAAASGDSRSPDLSELLTASPDGGSAGAARETRRGELTAALGSGLLLRTLLDGSADVLPRAIAALSDAAAHLPPEHARRPDALSDLGLACLIEARVRGRTAPVQAAIRMLLSAASGCPSGHPRRPAILLRAAGALAVDGQAGYAPDVVDQGIQLLTDALRTAGLVTFGERSRSLYGLSCTLLIRYTHAGDAADLDRAISSLEEARAGLDPAPGDPFMVPLLRTLAMAYRIAGSRAPGFRRRQSRSIGRSVLHAHSRAVLLQTGSGQGLAAARRTGADTLRLAGWCLADGKDESAVEALELGRGLVLHAATVAADVPALLREADRPGLADEWNAQVPPAEGSGDRNRGDVPSDLRHRVLTALGNGAAERRLLSAPTVPQIAAALRSVRMDALVYLIPASGDVTGRALIVSAEGTVEQCGLPELSVKPGDAIGRYAAAQRDLLKSEAERAADTVTARRRRDRALGDLCDWAWTAAVGPVLGRVVTAPHQTTRPPRLTIAPIGALGIVPWHAARHADATPGAQGRLRYACEDTVFSSCASARQLVDAAARRVIPRGESAVFVANPTRDLPWSMREADAICSALYPDAVYLGSSRTTAVTGIGTPGEVLDCLPASDTDRGQPSLLHLGCHAIAGDSPDHSRLLLARGGELPISRVLAQAHARAADAPGGLVVLAACTSDLTLADHDEALTLASAFLAAGAAGVVGSRWEVPDMHTALLMFVFHRHLVRYPADSPADALRAAQLWMLDPRRRTPGEMPERLAAKATRPDLADPYAWAAFTYHGQ